MKRREKYTLKAGAVTNDENKGNTEKPRSCACADRAPGRIGAGPDRAGLRLNLKVIALMSLALAVYLPILVNILSFSGSYLDTQAGEAGGFLVALQNISLLPLWYAFSAQFEPLAIPVLLGGAAAFPLLIKLAEGERRRSLVFMGFLALFGIASDNGVVIASYLDQTFAIRKPFSKKEIRDAVLEAGIRRVRPCLMTTATTILALVPVLTSAGRGSDIMVPMALPTFGGMMVSVVYIFLVPVLYSMVQELKANKNRSE